MKDRYLLFVISLLFCCLLQAQEKIDSLLVVLDRTIENTAQYEQARLKRIDQIKEYFRTRKSTSPSEEYHINQQLFDEYEAYICDSARYYINRNIEIALQNNNQDWLNEAKLKKASILGKTGLYAEGVKIRNVAGEMLGAMNAVQWAKEHEYPAVEIRYDYEGVEKWVTGVWRAKTPLTSKYAAHMQEAAEQIKISFCKVAAHTGNHYNEEADQLAKSALLRTDENVSI